MKLTFVILTFAIIASLIFLTGCKKRDAQAEAQAAVARGEYQFVALCGPDGKWTHPQVPEIPEWYFQTTGIRIRQTNPETQEADVAYMTSYNEALYRTLKAQGKFHVIEEDVAKLKANLDRIKK